jgi:hypothetical protein
MRLSSWSVWLQYELDPTSGTYRRRFVRDPKHAPPISGQGGPERTAEHGTLFFCVYRWAGDLVFQAGTRRWSLARHDLRLELSGLSPTRSCFRVVAGGDETFRATYRHLLRTLAARLDVTSDGIDFERDHFLARMASLSLPATLTTSPGWREWLDGAPAQHRHRR